MANFVSPHDTAFIPYEPDYLPSLCLVAGSAREYLARRAAIEDAQHTRLPSDAALTRCLWATLAAFVIGAPVCGFVFAVMLPAHGPITVENPVRGTLAQLFALTLCAGGALFGLPVAAASWMMRRKRRSIDARTQALLDALDHNAALHTILLPEGLCRIANGAPRLGQQITPEVRDRLMHLAGNGHTEAAREAVDMLILQIVRGDAQRAEAQRQTRQALAAAALGR